MVAKKKLKSYGDWLSYHSSLQKANFSINAKFRGDELWSDEFWGDKFSGDKFWGDEFRSDEFWGDKKR